MNEINIRIKDLTKKIKKKNITLRNVIGASELLLEYQCFRCRFFEPKSHPIGVPFPKEDAWIQVKSFRRARKEIKTMIARAILYNQGGKENQAYYDEYKKKYHGHIVPVFLNGLYGEDKINMKKIIFANHYGKYIYKHGMFYECYVKTEF